MGLDDMGTTPGNFFTGLTFTVGNATVPGALIGANGISLTTGNMPAHAHSGTTATESVTHTHTVTVTGSGNTGTDSVNHVHGVNFVSGLENQAHNHNYSFNPFLGNSGPVGGGGVSFSPSDPTETLATGTENQSHNHNINGTSDGVNTFHTHAISGLSSSGTTAVESALHTHTFTTDTQGSGTSFNNLSRKRLVTWFIKL
jgi:hypothetical protein